MKTIKNALQWITNMVAEADYYTLHRKANGRIDIVGHRKRKMKPTEKQRATMNRFTQATRYAKKQMADQAMYELYKKGITQKSQSAYSVAIKDALTAPEIHNINTGKYHGIAGDVIMIKASDDFKVTRVRVIIKDSEGTHVECGDAVKYSRKRNIWNYTAKISNPHLHGTTITATAFDLPGNETTREMAVEPNHQISKS
jgi:hypothetical protein